MISRSHNSISPRGTERGYILITLVLFVTLIAIAVAVMAPAIAFQMKRDREQELIHRGVQYSRAIKHYVKKFGRYPTRIEELENTNQVRFLRRRYKDPITGKDFKLLHMGDVQMASAGGIAGANPVNGLNPGAAGAAGAPGLGPRGALGALAGGLAAGANSGGLTATGAPPGAPPATDTPPPSTGAAAPNSDENTDSDTEGATPGPGTPGQGTGLAGARPGATGAPGTPGAAGALGTGNSASGPQVFGGGPMVGVASTSKEKTIRVFNKKDRYNQWQFIYDPSTDRGGLLTTPYQPPSLDDDERPKGVPGAPGAGAPSTGPQPGTGTQSGPTSPGTQLPQIPQIPPDQGP